MKSRRRTFAHLVSLALAAVVFGGCANSQSHDSKEADADSVSPGGESESSKDREQGSTPTVNKRVELSSQIPDTVEATLPSVVGISTKRVVESRPHRFPFGNPFAPFGGEPPSRERKQSGMGSGVVVDADGTILTNNHVVEGADEIRVSFSDRRSEFDAEIVGTDEGTDLAVLKLKDPPDELTPINFGDSDTIRLGEAVLAIGNPFGLNSSVTYGIVSAKGRADVGLADYEDFIQTDAAINPGNSGGALVNLEGELIGINTAILSRSGGYQGIGFAIPSNMARSVMKKLVETGEVQRGHLGVMIQSLTPELAEAFEIPKDTAGVVISRVQEGSPADEHGLERGDVLTEFNGKPIEDASDLRNRVAHTSPGTKVELTIRRDGTKKKISVELGSLHGGPGRTQIDQQGILKGLVLGSLDEETRDQLDIPDSVDKGVAVVELERGSPAARTGLRPGDVILEANRKPIESIGDFKQAYEEARSRLLLLVYRDGGTLFLAIRK